MSNFQDAVDIPDDNLAYAIRAALQLDEGTAITVETMHGLTKLNARGAGIADLAGLEHAVNLTVLSLDDTAVSDVSALANLTNLTMLGLDRTGVSDVSALAHLTQLTWLYLGYTEVSDIAPLANLTNLRRLYLIRTAVSDIEPLTNLTQLEELYLGGCPLDDASRNIHVPALRKRGVRVLLFPKSRISDDTQSIKELGIRIQQLEHRLQKCEIQFANASKRD